MTTNILRTIEASQKRIMHYRSEQQHAKAAAHFSLRYFQALHALEILESCLSAMFNIANNNEETESAFDYLLYDKVKTQVYDYLAIACKTLNTDDSVYSNVIYAIAQFDNTILSFCKRSQHVSEQERKAITYAIDFFKAHANDTAIVSIETLEQASTHHNCENVKAIYSRLHEDHKQAINMMQQQKHADAIDRFAILNMQACQAFEILESNLQTILRIANAYDETAIDTFYDTFCHIQEIAYTTYTNNYFDDAADDTADDAALKLLQQKALKLFNSAKYAIASLNNANCKYAFDYTLLSNMTHCMTHRDYSRAIERLHQMQLSKQERNRYMKAIERFQQREQSATLTSVEAIEQRSK